MNKLLGILIFSIVLFLIIRFTNISEYGKNKELFTGKKDDLADSYLQGLYFIMKNKLADLKSDYI